MYGCLLYREKAVVVTFEYIFILNFQLIFTRLNNDYFRVYSATELTH